MNVRSYDQSSDIVTLPYADLYRMASLQEATGLIAAARELLWRQSFNSQLLITRIPSLVIFLFLSFSHSKKTITLGLSPSPIFRFVNFKAVPAALAHINSRLLNSLEENR